MIEVNNNIGMDFIAVAITIIIQWLLAQSSGHFWWPEEFENVANPDFEYLEHL